MLTLPVSAMVATLATAVSNWLPDAKALCSAFPIPAAASTLVRVPTSVLPRLFPA